MKKNLTLDLRNIVCPLSFLKTRQFLTKHPLNSEKYLLINSKKTLAELTKTFCDLEIDFKVREKGSDDFIIIISAK
mgnify:FL=1